MRISFYHTLAEKSIQNSKNNKKIIVDNVGSGYAYTEYTSLKDMINAINTAKVEYAIVPRYYALKDIVENKLYINYTFNNLTNKIVLRTSDNKKLNSIMNKYLENYSNELLFENEDELIEKMNWI